MGFAEPQVVSLFYFAKFSMLEGLGGYRADAAGGCLFKRRLVLFRGWIERVQRQWSQRVYTG